MQITSLPGVGIPGALPRSLSGPPSCSCPDHGLAVVSARPGREGTSLDTLGQLPTSTKQDFPEIFFSGDYEPTPEQLNTLTKRARRKLLTSSFAERLAAIPYTTLERSYRSSLGCSGLVTVEPSGLAKASFYCDQRWCLVCASIRTAKLINGYAPQLEAWSSSWFVTLTAPNVAGTELSDEVSRYLTAFSNIVRVVREKQRIRFRALRKLECTYNSVSRTYHPHFHIIVDGEEAARAIVAGWLRRWPAAVESAQDVRRADSAAVRELFKYFTKIVTKTTQERAGGSLPGVDARANIIHTRSLDTIFQAVRGRRTFQPYGLKAVCEDIDPNELEATLQIGAWPTDYYWSQIAADWIDPTTGAVLAQYQPSPAVAALLERIE